MSNWDEIGFAPQGWQCPICGAVYSPMTMQCFNCTGWKISNMTDSTTKGDADIDIYSRFLKHKEMQNDET